VASLFKVVLHSEQKDQGALNRFWFSTDGGDAAEMASLFSVVVLPKIMPFVSNKVDYVGLSVQNVLNVADAVIKLTYTNTTGQRTGEGLPPFTSHSFQLLEGTQVFRSGRKAFMGVSESDQDEGVPNPLLDTLYSDMSDILSAILLGALEEYIPVLATVNAAGTIYTIAQIVGALFRRISTQNSRKPISGGGPIPVGAFDNNLDFDSLGDPFPTEDPVTTDFLRFEAWLQVPNTPVKGLLNVATETLPLLN